MFFFPSFRPRSRWVKPIERKDFNYELIQINNNDKNSFTMLGDIGAAYRSASACYADGHSTRNPTPTFGAEQHQVLAPLFRRVTT